MFLGDFHIHTTYSDGHLSIAEVVDYYGLQGFGALAITDHLCEDTTFLGKAAHWLDRTLNRHNFQSYMNEIEMHKVRAWEQYRMVVIPGYEITKNSLDFHRSAHVLALGVTQFIDPSLEIETMIDKIHEYEGLAIAAHPVPTRRFEAQTYHLWSRRRELADKFDAWEVASGRVLFKEVAATNLPVIASSDLHHPRQMTSWKSVMSCEKSHGAIFQAIRTQELGVQFYNAKEGFLEKVKRLSLRNYGLQPA